MVSTDIPGKVFIFRNSFVVAFGTTVWSSCGHKLEFQSAMSFNELYLHLFVSTTHVQAPTALFLLCLSFIILASETGLVELVKHSCSTALCLILIKSVCYVSVSINYFLLFLQLSGGWFLL